MRLSRSRSRVRLAVAALVPLVMNGSVISAEPGSAPTKEQVAFFEKKIRPILVKNCLECHSGSTQAPGGLRLDTPEGVRIGGTRGALIDHKKPESSLLLKSLKPEGGFRLGRGARQMPPAGPLTDDEIADITAWVKQGAPDPRMSTPRRVPGEKIDIEKARTEGWAYQPVKKPAVPESGKGWAWSPVDNFIAATQAKTGTKPGADADPLVWLRRVSVDLVGLPPTLEHIAALKADSSRKSREKVVDALLASKAFGERWGRHWMDVARYAESTGKERNYIYPQAWRYRDWVIDSFNEDKPYNRFLTEQIAGDLLPAKTAEERDANLVATGFLALGPKGLNDRNRESFLMEIVDEQIENIGRGVLALSIGCARCHEHKFDPILMSDYYALAGIFRSTDTRAGVQNRQFGGGRTDLLVPLSNAKTAQADPKLDAEIAQAVKELGEKRDRLAKLRGGPPAANPPVPETPEIVAAQEAFAAANERLADLRAREALPTVFTHAIATVDREEPRDTTLRYRGEVDLLGPVIPRGFPKVVSVANPPTFDDKESGRRQLADWLTRADHPLTSRVFVNRIWSKLFGAGIVPTVDDFGDQGQKPTHPELLDFLAWRFIDQGWSVKKTVRELVLSRTYQLGSSPDADNLAKDETNVSLWRFSRRRLDAEVIRDSTLAASGQLDVTRPIASSVTGLRLRELGPDTNFAPVQKPSRHRSVYLPIVRHKSPEALAIFDLPDPSLVIGTREASTSPGQALYLLNSPFALAQASAFADRILAGKGLDEAGRIERAYLLSLARKPSAAEQNSVKKFLASWPAKDGETSEAQERAAWAALTQALLALPEFRYLQ